MINKTFLKFIGQSLNAAGNERVARAVSIRDHRSIAEIAKRQVSAGADVLDLCAAAAFNEPESLAWLAQTVQEFVDIPLSLDSANIFALTSAAAQCRCPPVLNSYSGAIAYPDKFRALCEINPPLSVVVLCADASQIPVLASERVEIAQRLVSELIPCGITLDQVIFDPITEPAITGVISRATTLETTALLRSQFPQAHILCAVGNFGYGHARRRPLEREFAFAARDFGADMFLCDLLDSRLLDGLR